MKVTPSSLRSEWVWPELENRCGAFLLGREFCRSQARARHHATRPSDVWPQRQRGVGRGAPKETALPGTPVAWKTGDLQLEHSCASSPAGPPSRLQGASAN